MSVLLIIVYGSIYTFHKASIIFVVYVDDSCSILQPIRCFDITGCIGDEGCIWYKLNVISFTLSNTQSDPLFWNSMIRLYTSSSCRSKTLTKLSSSCIKSLILRYPLCLNCLGAFFIISPDFSRMKLHTDLICR